MKRRSFFPALAAGLLAPLRAPAIGVCRTTDFSYAAKYNVMFSKAKPWQGPVGPPATRKLWSKMQPGEQAGLLKTLSDAYSKIAATPSSGDASLLAKTWTGQGWIHNHVCADSGTTAGDIHDTSGFLMWHRAFVYFHELLLRSVSTDANFALPVWDWENCIKTPSAYNGWVHPPPPDGVVPCALTRNQVPVAIDTPCLRSWLTCATPQEFLGPPSVGTPGNSFNGPHDLVHTYSGPFMANAQWAALDPLFFAHHTNMDRWFCAWWAYYKGKPGFDPGDLQWPKQTWYFYDPVRNCPVSVDSLEFTSKYLDDTNKLGYSYAEPAVAPVYPVSIVNSTGRAAVVKLDIASVNTFLDELEQAEKAAGSVRNAVPILNRFDQLFANIDPVFSVHAIVSVPAIGLKSGKYYGVGVKTPDLQGVRALGGFGVFGHLHHVEWKTPLVQCMRKDVFRSLVACADQQGGRVVYGPLSTDGKTVEHPKPVAAVTGFEILYPQDLSILLK